MDLTTWDAQYYRPGWWTRTKLRLGAEPRRCEPCRCNFASFRPQKTSYKRAKAVVRKIDVRRKITEEYELPEFDPTDRLFPQKENGSK